MGSHRFWKRFAFSTSVNHAIGTTNVRSNRHPIGHFQTISVLFQNTLIGAIIVIVSLILLRSDQPYSETNLTLLTSIKDDLLERKRWI